jgi:predicted peptidase
MLERIVLTLAFLGPLLLTTGACADVQETGFLNRGVTVGGNTYRYQVFLPAGYTATERWPALLALHGAGERGSDGFRQTQVGIASAIRWSPEQFPCIVVLPQAPADSSWLGEPATAALAALDATLREFAVDPDRVSLTGISMGGYGVWHLAFMAPDRFAAIVPVCGGIVPSARTTSVHLAPENAGQADPYTHVAARVASIPVWIFHGAQDDIIPVSESQRMVAALKAAGAAPLYTEYPGIGHGCWDRAYGEPDLWKWVLAQRRPGR